MNNPSSNSSGGFTQEQQEYLLNLMSRLNLHMAFQSGSGQEPEPENVFGVPIEDLCKEELAKYKKHPLDIWPQLEKWTEADEIATGIDQFMLRHLGFFNVEPNSQGYMVRLRIPACRLRGDQMVALAEISENLAGGYAHVTTRGNFQMREIRPKNVLNYWEALRSCGLSCQGSGSDSARNITASPTAGFDKLELIDLSHLAIRLSNRILVSRDLQYIPRKFNISFDNGGTISCVSDTNDIAFLGVNIRENNDGVEPGIYCRISLGGITGHKDFARDTGIICRPEDTVQIADAMLRVFMEHGDRTNRKKARLKYLLDGQGFDWFIERTEEQLEKFGTGVKLIRKNAEHDQPRTLISRTGHIGVHPQKQSGLNYIGLALELGRLSPEQMRLIGKLAQQYGQNDVRLTVWQNVLIPYIKDQDVATVLEELAKLDIGVDATSFAAGAVSCTGKWGCKFALAYTKQDALKLVRYLESKFTLDKPINIHLTGCQNSCAQHYIGDIGLIGSTGPDGGEGYNIVLGGGSDADQGLGRPLCGPVASEDINEIIEQVIENYLALRNDGEPFLDFTRRQSDKQLQQLANKNTL